MKNKRRERTADIWETLIKARPRQGESKKITENQDVKPKTLMLI